MATPVHSLAGAAIGAVAGLFVGMLAALVGSFFLILFAFAKDDDAWWARVLIQPPAVWLLLGALSGATIGLIVARRERPEGLPLRPDAA
jgi:ABC-type xylose transport system permease subunit